MTSLAPPFSVLADLGAVPDHEVERTLVPTAEERQAIARWLGVEAMESLEVTVRLRRRSEHHYSYEARFDASVIQACVVTLTPVASHVTGEFRRDFRVRPRGPAKRRKQVHSEPASIELTGLEDDEAEWLDDPVIDLAAPVLEELTLALDPYPRAPGAAFEAPTDETTAHDSPFAVLQKLKTEQGRRPAGKKAENGAKGHSQAKKKG